MKRAGHLMQQVTTRDNLYQAWLKARRGKMHRPEVLAYEANLDAHLDHLRWQLQHQQPDVGNYHYFTISDPKVRQICAAAFPERVLHHALMRVCHPVFEKHLICHTYATRKQKGTYAALEQVKKYTKKFRWFVKLDVRKYFDSIDHSIVHAQLRRLFKDPELLTVLNKILDTYHTTPRKGLPIGNLTSQYLANHYFSGADHFALEQLRVGAYVRYMDDILLFGQDRIALMQHYKAFRHYVETQLQVTFKPMQMGHVAQGIPYLGYRLYPNRVMLGRNSKQRFKRKYKRYCENLAKEIWNEKDFQEHVLPLLAYVIHADSLQWRRQFFQREQTNQFLG